MFSVNISRSKDNFNAKPILINYNNSFVYDSTIIVYGNQGSGLISQDNDKTWDYVRLFDSGLVSKIFFQNNKFVAFTTDGQIAISQDKGHTWLLHSKLDFEIMEDSLSELTEILQIKDGYIIRKNNFIYKIDNNFNLIKQVNCELPYFFIKSKINSYQRQSVLIEEDRIIFYLDTFKLGISDFDLTKMDTINLNKNNQFTCEYCISFFHLVKDDKYYYCKNGLDIYKISKDFQNVTKLNIDGTYFILEGTFDNKVLIRNFYTYSFDSQYLFLINDTLYPMAQYDYTYFKRYENELINIVAQNVNIVNNKMIISGIQNKIIIIDLKDDISKNVIKTISDNSFRNAVNIELIKSKNNFYSLRRESKGVQFAISKFNHNDTRFNLVTKTAINAIDTNYFFMAIDYLPFYSIDNNDYLYFGGKWGNRNLLFISKDGGYTFDTLRIDYLDFSRNKINLELKENLTHFIFTEQLSIDRANTHFYFIDKNINLIKTTTINNERLLLYQLKDTNDIITFVESKPSNILSFKSTTDNGTTWEVLKDYPKTINVLEYKKLVLNGNTIFTFSYFDRTTNKFNLDVLNVNNKLVYNVFFKELAIDEIENINRIGFDAAKEKFYLSFYNTLLVSSNIFDENIKWKSFNYPNNGRVNKKLQVFDKTIFARYEDDKNEDNVYWINGIEMVGDPTSVEDIEKIEEVNYIYTMPPYPNPTVSEVTAKFYWDSRIDIDNSEIGVFDITGNKVSGKENLSIEKLNEWSGNIKWNCTGVPKGTYLIKIQHGNNTKTVKVVVN